MRLHLLLAICLSLALGACSDGKQKTPGKADQTPRDVIAKVGELTLTRQELNRAVGQLVNNQRASQDSVSGATDRLQVGFRDTALKELVSRKVQLNEAQKQNITVTDEDIDKHYKKLLESFPDEKALITRVQKLGYADLKEYKQDLNNDLLIVKLQLTWIKENQAEVSEEEIVSLYTKNQSQLKDEKTGRIPPLEEIRDRLTQGMINLKTKKNYETWVSELRATQKGQIIFTNPEDRPEHW
jgi:SurA-like N-terminal domain